MAGFNVMDMLNKTSKEGIEEKPKARFRTKDIDIYNIYANEDNISDQNGIDEKAAEIKLLGLLQPLEVMYEPNKNGEEYKLIGGERRWRALKKLVEEEDLQEFREATCQIRKPRSKNEEIIELCISNSYRKATPEKELERIKLLTDALKDAKAAGEKIMGYDLESGRLRDIAAKILGKKPTQIANAMSINNNLIPELRKLLEKHLREEGDHRSLFRSAQKIDFYPRPPRGGRPTSSLPSWRGGNFYPRPPRGGRQAYKTDGWVGLAFLSTPSARRATWPAHRGRRQIPISIHALREEGDVARS